MKTIIALLVILSVMSSCKKEGGVCWKCTYGIYGGYQKPDSTICNDGEEPEQGYDASGNVIGQICTKQ